jgi:hypothetical protein
MTAPGSPVFESLNIYFSFLAFTVLIYKHDPKAAERPTHSARRARQEGSEIEEDIRCDLDGRGENRINDEVIFSFVNPRCRSSFNRAFLLLEANSVSTCIVTAKMMFPTKLGNSHQSHSFCLLFSSDGQYLVWKICFQCSNHRHITCNNNDSPGES